MGNNQTSSSDSQEPTGQEDEHVVESSDTTTQKMPDDEQDQGPSLSSRVSEGVKSILNGVTSVFSGPSGDVSSYGTSTTSAHHAHHHTDYFSDASWADRDFLARAPPVSKRASRASSVVLVQLPVPMMEFRDQGLRWVHETMRYDEDSIAYHIDSDLL